MEDSEGEIRFPDPSRVIESNVPEVEGLEGDLRGAVSTLSWVTALIATEHDITACGRVGTELGTFFRLFVRFPAESSEFDVWDFVRDPETGVDGVDCRGACVGAAGPRSVFDSTGLVIVEGVLCPCRSGTTTAGVLGDKVNDRVSGTGRANFRRNAQFSYRSLVVVEARG